MTDLEKKVKRLIGNYISSDLDIYPICKNIINAYGEAPTASQIEEEVDFFYNVA